MSEKKFRCSNCGKILTENQKFCTACGTKNEFIEYTETLASDISEVSGNSISDGNTLAQSKEENSNLGLNKTTENIEYKQNGKGHKKLLITAISIAAVLVLVFCGFKVYALLNPNYIPMKAVANTIRIYTEEENNYISSIPVNNLLSDKGSEHELQLKINDINTGSENIFSKKIINMISEYALTLKSQYIEKSSSGSLSLSLKKSDEDVIDGDVYFDDEKIAIDFPDLIDDVLGYRQKTSDNDKYSKDIISKESLDKIINIINEQNKEYIQYFLYEINFKKNGKNSYNAILDTKRLIQIEESYIMQLVNNEFIKNTIIDLMASSSTEYSRTYYQDYYDSIILQIPDYFSQYLEQGKFEDINLNITVKDNIVNSISVDTKLHVGEDDDVTKLSFEAQTEKEKSILNTNYKFRIASSENILMTGSVIYDNSGKEATRSINSKITIDDIQIKYSVENIQKTNKEYEDIIKVDISTYDDNISVGINNSYKLVSKDNIEIKDITISVSEDNSGTTFNIGFEGYLKNNKLDTSKTLKSKNIIYFDELNDNDIERIVNKMEKQLMLKFSSFGNSFNI